MTQSLFDAYAAGRASAFYPSHFANAADRRAAVACASRPLAPQVAAAIERQNARYASSPARDAHLAALRAGAAAVVTGQQVGLFLGPLYTLCKAASAVVCARALTEECGAPVVPVFWLQSEDHDLAEIARVHVQTSAGEPLALSVPTPANNRVSVAHHGLPPEVTTCLGVMSDALRGLPHATEHVAHLARHYTPGTGWVAAFAGLLAELFAGEGLVLVDPRDADLADCLRPVHRRAFEQHEEIARMLAARREALSHAGFAETVRVRDDAPLSFFHADGPASPRVRLRAVAGGFRDPLTERSYGLDRLLEAIDRDPLCVSTSALLRPIAQDTLLPTAVYVGGPAELAYFAQLAPLYAHFGLPMPVIAPRASLRVLEDKTLRLLARLGVPASDACQDEDTLLARANAATPATAPHATLDADLAAAWEEALSRRLATLGELAPEVAVAADKSRATLRSTAHKFAQKYARSLLHRDTQRVTDVRRLRELLFPMGAPQERVLGLSCLAARYGERPLLDRVLGAIEPWQAQVRDLPIPS